MSTSRVRVGCHSDRDRQTALARATQQPGTGQWDGDQGVLHGAPLKHLVCFVSNPRTASVQLDSSVACHHRKRGDRRLVALAGSHETRRLETFCWRRVADWLACHLFFFFFLAHLLRMGRKRAGTGDGDEGRTVGVHRRLVSSRGSFGMSCPGNRQKTHVTAEVGGCPWLSTVGRCVCRWVGGLPCLVKGGDGGKYIVSSNSFPVEVSPPSVCLFRLLVPLLWKSVFPSSSQKLCFSSLLLVRL